MISKWENDINKNKAHTASINKESCPFIVVIVVDYFLVQTVEFFTINIVVKGKEAKH